jgi:hypothetical protein
VGNSLGTAITQPAFHAFATAGQSLGAFSTSKVVMQNVLYDNTDSFNNTAVTVVKNGLSVPSYSFMPTVAGYYQINYAVRQSSASSEIVAQIAKNNATFALATDPTSNVLSSAGSALVYLNGTTDFIHVLVFVAASVTVASRISTISGANVGFDTYFSGIYLGNGVVNSSDASQSSTTQNFGMRNRLINGAMSIDQRNVGASQSIVAAAALAYTVDRWYAYSTGASVTGQRVGGTGALQHVYQFTGAAGNTAIGFGQRIETINCYDLINSTVTLSAFLANSLLSTVTWTAFYANSADTFGTLASPTRTQIATGSWTVSSTLTRYTTRIDIPDMATNGIEIVFTVGAQISGTWRIGAVQLEPGTVATPFDRRPIGTELQLCYRYYEIMAIYTLTKGSQYDSNGWVDVITYSEKRIVPIITTSSAMSQPAGRVRTNRALLTSVGPVDGGSAFINAEM